MADLDWPSDDEIIDVLLAPGGPIYKEVQRRTIKVVRHAKRVVRVDTGRLRSSITSSDVKREGDNLSVDVGSDVEYAIYVEARYPYLRPALQAAK